MKEWCTMIIDTQTAIRAVISRWLSLAIFHWCTKGPQPSSSSYLNFIIHCRFAVLGGGTIELLPEASKK